MAGVEDFFAVSCAQQPVCWASHELGTELVVTVVGNVVLGNWVRHAEGLKNLTGGESEDKWGGFATGVDSRTNWELLEPQEHWLEDSTVRSTTFGSDKIGLFGRCSIITGWDLGAALLITLADAEAGSWSPNVFWPTEMS